MQDLNKKYTAFTRNGLGNSINQEIVIYTGEIILKSNLNEITLFDTVVHIEWIPTPRIVFAGNLTYEKNHSLEVFEIEWNIFFNKKQQGKGMIFSQKYDTNIIIKGELIEYTQEIEFSKFDEVQFSLINFPEVLGEHMINLDSNFWKGRFEVKIGNAILIIDTTKDLNKHLKELKSQNGYMLTHHCRLEFQKLTKGSEVFEYLESIRLTLRILIGQDLGFGLLYFLKDKNISQRLQIYGKIKPIENCHRLLNMNSWISHCEFFDQIYRHSIKGKTDKPILDLIHWYNMSNTNQGYAEGSLLLSQVGVELLYNWIICEHLQMVTKKDANEKISAASKLKTLFVYSGINLEEIKLPNELSLYKIGENKQSNAEVIISLRNHLVHSNEGKRSQLAKYDPIIFAQARNIQLFIIERYFLALGAYDRAFFNRLNNKISDTQDFKINFH